MDKLKAAELVLKHRANLRKIWAAIAIATACLTAMLVHLFCSPHTTDPMRLTAFFTLAAIAVGAIWYAGRLGKENLAIQRELGERDK